MSLELSLYDFPSQLREMMDLREQLEDELAEIYDGSKPPATDEENARADDLEQQIRVLDEMGLKPYYEALPKKVDDLGAAWKWLEALAGTSSKQGAIDREIERLKERRDRFRKRLESIKTMVHFVMEAMPWKEGKSRKLEGVRHTLYLKGNGGKQAVEVYDEALVPDEFCSVTVTMPVSIWHDVLDEIDIVGVTGVKEGPRIPSLSLIGAEMEKPCGRCGGAGTLSGHPRIERVQCIDCGGSGRRSVAGCRLAERGQHVEIR